MLIQLHYPGTVEGDKIMGCTLLKNRANGKDLGWIFCLSSQKIGGVRASLAHTPSTTAPLPLYLPLDRELQLGRAQNVDQDSCSHSKTRVMWGQLWNSSQKAAAIFKRILLAGLPLPLRVVVAGNGTTWKNKPILVCNVSLKSFGERWHESLKNGWRRAVEVRASAMTLWLSIY